MNRYITDEDYAVAESNGISKFTVDARVRTLYWEIEKAITQKPRVLNRIPKIVLDSLKKNNISKTTYNTRINIGWSVEDACTIPTGSKTGINKLRPRCDLCDNCEYDKTLKGYICNGKNVTQSRFDKNSPKDCPKRRSNKNDL